MATSKDSSDEFYEYFDEIEFKPEKPILMSTEDSSKCFFGRFSVPTHTQNMSGVLLIDYLPQKEGSDTCNVKCENFDIANNYNFNQINVQIRDSNSRNCIGNPISLKNSNYLAVIDRGTFYEAKILDGLFVFEPNINGKYEGSSDIAENIKRDHIVREAVVSARILESSSNSVTKIEKEEDSNILAINVNAPQNSSKESTCKQEINDRLDDIYDEDFGLRQQEKRRKISAFFNKEKSKDDSLFVGSALSLTTLKNDEDWDYDKDGKMSDDEEYIEKGEFDQNYEDEHNPEIINANFNSEDEEGPDGMLTEYGQSLKTMIANQQDMEADEELNVYSDEIDEELEIKSNISSSVQNMAETSSSQQKSNSEIQFKENKSPTVLSSMNTGNRSLEDEVIRKLSLAGGRMQIKPFLDAMKVKKKNKYFEEIQEIIKKVADTHTEYHSNNKVSYITLKSNYRQR
ncbi:hypothetical protein FG386_003170 [Cryptosporidium ryanae]|uniref:uncharacterized protein n=1 Tax=Cryptosporidium ryanae TaxID=515981 RepID=UPI00351A3E25|nr:hypothetical protein FG386_003170 [Cryptosporidium ryanae]